MTVTLMRAARGGKVLRIGHKGAAALAPENTLESIAAALEHDVDLVEVDVVDAPDGTLVLGHSHHEIEADAPTLDEALAFFAAEAPREVGIDLDLKWHGFESQLAAALRRHGLVERAVASSFFAHSLRSLRGVEPGLRTGISYPWDRHNLSLQRPLWPLVVTGAAALRTALPYRIRRMASRAEARAAMLHFSVVSPAVVSRCHSLGLPVFAWTVDDPALLRRMIACGVDGVISNDPRIFAADGE
jgi:glycerophosphoryl diester phosphodiesterase